MFRITSASVTFIWVATFFLCSCVTQEPNRQPTPKTSVGSESSRAEEGFRGDQPRWSSWDEYRPYSMKQLMSDYEVKVNEDVDSYFEFSATNSYRFKMTLTYTGRSRAIPSGELKFIRLWFKQAASVGINERLANLFEQEFLFFEDSKAYWLPVQTQLIPYFRKELKRGDSAHVFLLWIGHFKNEAKRAQRVLLVNEFNQ